MLISVLWMVVGLGFAESASGEGVPREGEISRTVAPGARAVIMHEWGERHPVSGEWARLERLAMGGSRAAPSESDTVETGSEEVSAGEVRMLPKSFFAGRAKERQERQERRGRIVRKVGSGALGGVLAGLGGAAIGAALGDAAEDCSAGDDRDDYCGLGVAFGALFLGTAGYTVGVAAGVSRVDPHDHFITALAGSAAGLTAGLLLGYAEDPLWPIVSFAGPIIAATVISELTRAPPGMGRLSFGLSPTPGRGVSAAASLRF